MEKRIVSSRAERDALVEELNALKKKGVKNAGFGLMWLMIGVFATLVSISYGRVTLWYGAILLGICQLIVGLVWNSRASRQLRELNAYACRNTNTSASTPASSSLSQPEILSASQSSDIRESFIFCPQCGYRNQSTSRFCSACGTPLEKLHQPVDETGTVEPQIYDFRHIRDVSNVVKYETLSEPLNHLFYSYLNQNLTDCEVDSKVAAETLFPNAPKYAMPINFLVKKGNKRVAVLLLKNGREYRYSVLETKELCKENGIEVLQFFLHLPNEERYVVERVRKALA